MGYELKLYVMDNLPTWGKDTERVYYPDLMVDLYKPGYQSEIYHLSKDYLVKDPDIVWYRYEAGVIDETDGFSGEEIEVKITNDPYGSYPIPCPISKVIDALRKDFADEPYRRFGIALSVLESYASYFPDAVVWFYGN